MKKIILLFATVIALQAVSAQKAHRIYTVEGMKKEFPQYISSDVKITPHPRILMLKGEEKKILRNIKDNKTLAKLHNTIVSFSEDYYLNAPMSERKQIGKRLLKVSMESLRRLFYLSYSYRVTKDKRFAKAAEDELLAVSEFTDWNPSHFLDVGEMTMAVAIGYDWVYDALSENSRKIIRTAILEKGLKPSLEGKYSTRWLERFNNWTQVCSAGMVYGALAIFEDEPELAAQIINRALKSTEHIIKCYEPDGAYPEGPNYWEYGTSFHVMMISAIEKQFGSDFGMGSTPAFLRSGEYKLNMITPTLCHYNYGDNPLEIMFSAPMVWFAAKTKDKRLVYATKQMANSFSSKSKKVRLLPAMIIWGHELDWDAAVSADHLSYEAHGNVPISVFRSSWTDKNALYLGIKGGHTTKVSHQHMDLGSFLFQADQVRWGCEFGKEEYYDVESKGVAIWSTQRWDVFRHNSLNHNLITVNGKWQNLLDTAYMRNVSHDVNNMNATIDLTKVDSEWLKHHVRTVGMKDKSYAYIIDSLETKKIYTRIRWNMVSEAEEMKVVSDNVALLTKGDKKLYMVVDAPKGVKVEFKTKSAQSETEYDSPNPGMIQVGFESTLPMSSKVVFKVYLVPRELRENLSVK